jgi:hypothetical protein
MKALGKPFLTPLIYRDRDERLRGRQRTPRPKPKKDFYLDRVFSRTFVQADTPHGLWRKRPSPPSASTGNVTGMRPGTFRMDNMSTRTPVPTEFPAKPN